MEEVVFKNWTKLDVRGTIPSVRQSHAITTIEDRAYLFGGSAVSNDSSSVFYNDLYCIQLRGSPETKHCWKLIEQSGEVPTGREGHSLIVVDDKDLYLLGGIESDGATQCAQDLYILNTETHCWSKSDTSGEIPQAQSSTTVPTNDGRIVTFGGVFKGKACNDTFIMDIASQSWMCPETTGNKPHSRCDHGCVVLDNRMYIYGGSGGEALWFNDLYYLDLDIMLWVSVDTVQSPCPRDYPSLLSINTKTIQMLVVFGGFTAIDGEERCLNDTHYLLLNSEMSWSPVASKDSVIPDARYGHSAFIFDNKIYLQGGQNNEMMFSDFWMLDVTLPEIKYSPTVPPRRDYTTAIPIPTPRKNLSLVVPKEFDPRSFEELRSQYVGQIGEMFDFLTEKFHELDEMEAKLKAEREQLDMERQELHDIYDKQQQELEELRDQHKNDNEKWIESIRLENDQNRKEIAEEKAKLNKDRTDLELEKQKFTEKSNRLDEIMKQFQGLK